MRAERLINNSAGVAIAGVAVHNYAVSPDGKRLLLRVSYDAETPEVEPLHLVLNWPSLVK